MNQGPIDCTIAHVLRCHVDVLLYRHIHQCEICSLLHKRYGPFVTGNAYEIFKRCLNPSACKFNVCCDWDHKVRYKLCLDLVRRSAYAFNYILLLVVHIVCVESQVV